MRSWGFLKGGEVLLDLEDEVGFVLVWDEPGSTFPRGGGEFEADGVGEPDGDVEGVGDALFDEAAAQVGMIHEEQEGGAFEFCADVAHKAGVEAAFFEGAGGDEGAVARAGEGGFE